METAARVEHNRWNVERLLMGYRPATTAERERANADDEYNEMLKKKYFIHINIAPYGEIPEETKENDRILTRFLYRSSGASPETSVRHVPGLLRSGRCGSPTRTTDRRRSGHVSGNTDYPPSRP